jgi:hypothetical protein
MCAANSRSAKSSRHASRAYGFTAKRPVHARADAESLWLVDPIDGTKAFVREYPMFSTQIALMRRGEIVLGVSSAPVYGETRLAERGSGAYLNGKRIAVSAIDSIEAAALSAGNLKTLASGGQWSRYGALGRARQSDPRVRRFPALSPAGGRQNRRRHRVGREHSRYRGAGRDRDRSRRQIHRFDGRADHAAVDLGARDQRLDACADPRGTHEASTRATRVQSRRARGPANFGAVAAPITTSSRFSACSHWLGAIMRRPAISSAVCCGNSGLCRGSP